MSNDITLTPKALELLKELYKGEMTILTATLKGFT